jgi:transposase-like protein
MPRITQPPPEGCLWIAEAATYIGVARSTLYKWRYLGVGPAGFPVARKVAYEIKNLDAYLDACKSTKPEPRRENEMRPPEPSMPRRRTRQLASAAGL